MSTMNYSKLMTLIKKIDKCLETVDNRTSDVVNITLVMFMNYIKKFFTTIKDRIRKVQRTRGESQSTLSGL